MPKISVKDLPINGKKIFLRVDFNVPLDENLNITDDTRIRESLPTIKYILENGGIPIIASHLGRPKGKFDPKQSLKPVAGRLGELLNREVKFAPDCIGPEVKKIVDGLKQGDVLLLENLRFHPEEEKNDANFAKELASLAEIYVNDAFGAAHRAHASVEAITHYFENPACGFLMEKELQYLEGALKNPKRPLLAIIGGAKVSTKIGVLKNLLDKVDNLVIGGGMCFTFYKAKGLNIGKSLCEDDFINETKPLLDNPKVYLPVDVVVAKDIKPGEKIGTVSIEKIPHDCAGVDIGENSIEAIKKFIQDAKTIVWNGPMGVFEIDEYAKGTEEVAKAIANATEKGAISIVGGGDTVAALEKFNLKSKISHVSTGGGASLEYLEGKELPGVKALKDK
ncbi:MAG: phosphoglycerate kinase [candidate division WOR-3 bacterium]|nr:phosphoglycerate kinase [candidate division WOR-3 bacterium]